MDGGELNGTSVRAQMNALAQRGGTGCLRVDPARGAATLLFLDAGRIYAVVVPGRRPSLGTRLVTAGVLDPETLFGVLDTQNAGDNRRLGDMLVDEGHVSRDLIESVVAERLLSDCDAVFAVTQGRWSFDHGATFRGKMTDPITVDHLCRALDQRRDVVARCRAIAPADFIVPVAHRPRSASEENLPAEARSLLSGIDGPRRVEELAQDFALTPHEGFRAVAALLEADLVLPVSSLSGDATHRPRHRQPAPESEGASAPDTGAAGAGHAPQDTHEALLRQAGTEAVRSAIAMASRAEKTAFARREAETRTGPPRVAASTEVDTAALMRELASLNAPEQRGRTLSRPTPS